MFMLSLDFRMPVSHAQSKQFINTVQLPTMMKTVATEIDLYKIFAYIEMDYLI